MIGQLVGNYRVTKLLGEGGMGAVYLAEHPGIGRKAAVKVLHPDLTRHPEIAARFFNEARAANAIRHPGIVEVLDFGTLPSGVSYIVMEFLGGESLAQRLRARRMAAVAAVNIASQAARALDAAHAAGIVHRDLKPDNLFLIPDPRNPGQEMVKVLDFGIAKLAAGSTDAASVKTRTGTVMGTPIYMSPEQCRGTKEVDHRTDVYALGIILYEMLCGSPPFMSDGHGELIHLHISQPPPSLRAQNPDVAEQLEAIVLRALAKDPANRFQTMADFAAALAGAPTGHSSLGAAPEPVGDGLRKPPAALAGATVLMASGTTLAASPGAVERARTTGRARSSILSVTVAAALVGGGYFYLSRPRASLIPLAAPTQAETRAPAPPPARQSATRPAPSIAVTLTSEPPGAHVIREKDGAMIGLTPVQESWPEATGVEKLRIELEGYRPESVAVPLDRGVDLAFALRRLAPAASHRRPPAQRPTTQLPAGRPASVPAPEAAPVAPTPLPPPKPVRRADPIPL